MKDRQEDELVVLGAMTDELKRGLHVVEESMNVWKYVSGAVVEKSSLCSPASKILTYLRVSCDFKEHGLRHTHLDIRSQKVSDFGERHKIPDVRWRNHEN